MKVVNTPRFKSKNYIDIDIKSLYHVVIQVLTAVTMKMAVFWGVSPCHLV
jgi:hypothetical protein